MEENKVFCLDTLRLELEYIKNKKAKYTIDIQREVDIDDLHAILYTLLVVDDRYSISINRLTPSYLLSLFSGVSSGSITISDALIDEYLDSVTPDERSIILDRLKDSIICNTVDSSSISKSVTELIKLINNSDYTYFRKDDLLEKSISEDISKTYGITWSDIVFTGCPLVISKPSNDDSNICYCLLWIDRYSRLYKHTGSNYLSKLKYTNENETMNDFLLINNLTPLT